MPFQSNRHDQCIGQTIKVVVTLPSGAKAVTMFKGSLVEAIHMCTRWP